jgi:AcrR family transcriptional regulator
METTAASTVDGLLPRRAGLSTARNRLFSTALVLFGQRGYHGVSVRDITDQLGQKPGAIYAHVQSKQELLFELVRIGHAEHRDWLRAALLDAGSDPAAQITAIVRAHVLVHLEFPALARVSNHESRFLDEAQRDAVHAVRSESELMLLDVIERGTRLGRFSVDDPSLAVTSIGAMGIQTAEWWTPESPRSPEQIADTFAAFALKILN